MKLFFKLIMAVVLLFVWTIAFAKLTQLLYFLVWGFNPFDLSHWQRIPEEWVEGWIIDTPSEFFFFFGMFLAVVIYIVGYIFLCKVPYIKLITLPFKKAKDKRLIEQRRKQDAFPGLEKMIEDLKAKQNKDGKISKSKMPPPLNNMMPAASKIQKPVQSKISKDKTRPEEDILDSFRDDVSDNLPKKKTSPEFTDYNRFDEDNFDFKPFESKFDEESKSLKDTSSAFAEPVGISAQSDVAKETDMSVAEPKVISRIDMKYETLMLAEKVGLDIVQDLKIGKDMIDFAILAKGVVYLINFEPVGKEWVADETSFDDDEPLWFSEAKYEISPVFKLNRATKIFNSALQDILTNSSAKVEVKKMLLVGGAAVLNYADVKSNWDESGVLSFRLSTGRPAEIPELSVFLRKLAENGSESESVLDMIYTAFVAVEP